MFWKFINSKGQGGDCSYRKLVAFSWQLAIRWSKSYTSSKSNPV